MNLFIEAFGGVNNNGAARALTPQTRLVCGVAVFAACTVAPLADWRGGVLLLATAAAWCAFCGLPPKRLAAVLKFALLLFLPLLLLALPARWFGGGEAVSWREALRAPFMLCARGIAGVVVTAATLSTFSLTTFAHGVAALPLPRAVASLLVQFTHQTFLLANESRRMVTALRVRGVPMSGVAARLRVLAALPVCWLARVANRADRVGSAMELRGFDGLPRGAPHARPSLRDGVALAVSLLVFGGALALRWTGAA